MISIFIVIGFTVPVMLLVITDNQLNIRISREFYSDNAVTFFEMCIRDRFCAGGYDRRGEGITLAGCASYRLLPEGLGRLRALVRCVHGMSELVPVACGGGLTCK